MLLDANPLIGIDRIRFGMERSKVRAIWGDAVEFKKTPVSETTTDDFGFCHVYYDENDECEAIEVFSESEVYVDGKKIFPIDLKKALGTFLFLSEDEDGAISAEKSVGICAPEGKMESILFVKDGYYDFLL